VAARPFNRLLPVTITWRFYADIVRQSTSQATTISRQMRTLNACYGRYLACALLCSGGKEWSAKFILNIFIFGRISFNRQNQGE